MDFTVCTENEDDPGEKPNSWRTFCIHLGELSCGNEKDYTINSRSFPFLRRPGPRLCEQATAWGPGPEGGPPKEGTQQRQLETLFNLLQRHVGKPPEGAPPNAASSFKFHEQSKSLFSGLLSELESHVFDTRGGRMIRKLVCSNMCIILQTIRNT